MIGEIFRGPFMTLGAILSPHDAWLLIRGLRTLPIRMQRVAESSLQVLAFLQSHPRVRAVHSPRATDNPQLGLTQRQLRGASGLMTIQLDVDDVASVERFCDGLTRFLMTVSWGGYESLAFPVAAVFPRDAPLHAAGGASLDLVRLSIGLEEPGVLIDDLRAAFERL
jgi:cystathionine beta-lyase/cystathionine gamma-synthase